MYRLVKAKERRARDLDQVKCIIDEENKVLVKRNRLNKDGRLICITS